MLCRNIYSADNNEWPNGYFALITLMWPFIVAHTVLTSHVQSPAITLSQSCALVVRIWLQFQVKRKERKTNSPFGPGRQYLLRHGNRPVWQPTAPPRNSGRQNVMGRIDLFSTESILNLIIAGNLDVFQLSFTN